MSRVNYGTGPTKARIDEIYHLRAGQQDQARKDRLLDRMTQTYYLRDGVRLSTEERLQCQYCNDGLVLFLGAGVSCASGLPSWSELVNDLAARAELRIESRYGCSEISASELLSREAGLSLPAQFSFIKAACGDNEEDFTARLYNSLYGKRGFSELKALLEDVPVRNVEKRQTGGLWKKIRKAVEETNQTLVAVANLMLNTEPLRCNPNIHAVMSVSADNLLQSYIMALAEGKRIVTTIDRPSVGEHPGKIPIFHLHGHLDTKEKSVDGDEADLPEMVFREREYFDVIASATGFANYTALSLLQKHNVLFVGTSLEDVNIRRWLHNSYWERVRARTKFLRSLYDDYQDAEVEAKYESVRHFWLRSERDLPVLTSKKPDMSMKKALECLMRDLGVEIVWYRNHDEVPEILRRLKAAECGKNSGNVKTA